MAASAKPKGSTLPSGGRPLIPLSMASPSSSSPIPSNARKVIQSMKEIVNCSEDEIYAMLKECNMDPNETVQRLLSQDPFHEVKRKKDKKKETKEVSGGKEVTVTEAKPRHPSSSRGGKSGRGGRGSNVNDFAGSREKLSHHREIDTDIGPQNTSALSSVPSAKTVPNLSVSQSNTSVPLPSNENSSLLQTASLSSSPSSSGRPEEVNPGAIQIQLGANRISAVSKRAASNHPLRGAVSLNHSKEGTVKHAASDHACSSGKDIKSASLPVRHFPPAQLSLDGEPASSGSIKSCHIDSSKVFSEQRSSQSVTSDAQIPNKEAASNSVTSGVVRSTRNQFNRFIYPGSASRSNGPILEWKPKVPIPAVASTVQPPAVATIVISNVPVTSAETSTVRHDITETVTDVTAKVQSLDLGDARPVIIPEHFQVPEEDCRNLSFGSFGNGFEATFSLEFGTLNKEHKAQGPESNQVLATPDEQPSSAVSVQNPILTKDPIQAMPQTSNITENGTLPPPLPPPPPPQSQPAKLDQGVQESSHYSFAPTTLTYPAFGLVPSGQYSYEMPESQSPGSRLSNLMHYGTDPMGSYYAPTFRPGTDGDARFLPFLATKPGNKFPTNVAFVNGQASTPVQEGSPLLLGATLPLQSQASQPTNAPVVATLPQHHLPIHSYSPQPMAPFPSIFGYHYLPSFPYMQTPYQHGFTENTGYPQQPSGNSYPTGNNYPASAVKIPMAQYKPTSVMANALHPPTAPGYAGYSSAPSGYASSPTVSHGNSTVYDDVSGSQYKDNAYIQGQQAEGSAIWVPARELASANPTGSYYNIQGHNQHHSYVHSQQHVGQHAPGYANLYHPPHSGSSHQVPQVIGAGVTTGSQGGSYQQTQRAPQAWINNF